MFAKFTTSFLNNTKSLEIPDKYKTLFWLVFTNSLKISISFKLAVCKLELLVDENVSKLEFIVIKLLSLVFAKNSKSLSIFVKSPCIVVFNSNNKPFVVCISSNITSNVCEGNPVFVRIILSK